MHALAPAQQELVVTGCSVLNREPGVLNCSAYSKLSVPSGHSCDKNSHGVRETLRVSCDKNSHGVRETLRVSWWIAGAACCGGRQAAESVPGSSDGHRRVFEKVVFRIRKKGLRKKSVEDINSGINSAQYPQ